MNVINSKPIPAGATHYNSRYSQGVGSEFYQSSNNEWFYYSSATNQWFTSLNQEVINGLVPINPSTTFTLITQRNEWYIKGEFPPAGIECLLSVYSPKRPIEWVKCYVVGLTKDRNAAVVQFSDHQVYSTIVDRTRFKPILTPLEEMTEIFNKGGLQGLIDAGYKK